MKTSSKMIIAITLVALLGSMLTGCAPKEAQSQMVRSDIQRESAPDVSPAELEELVSGNSAFAFDIYHKLRDEDNLLFSPYSMSAALAMAYAGARGETEQQMVKTLHFTLPQERLHAAFNALDLALGDQGGKDFRLHIANSLWGQQDYVFLADFLDSLAANYGAGLRLLDFVNEPGVSRKAVNGWVSKQTKGKIKDLIPENAITPNTRLVLANAIYFDARWAQPFDKGRTRDGAFYTLDGRETTVSMMNMDKQATLSFVQGQGYQAVELPYKGGQASMLLIVPDQGQFKAFERGLDAEQLKSIVEALDSKLVTLTMPKFSYESELSLVETLAAMGMPDAFDTGDADFSGMDGTHKLFISDAYHKAFVAVDEVGAKAAASTAEVIVNVSEPGTVTLTVDRPFVFVIRDMESGTILFVGRVVDPVG